MRRRSRRGGRAERVGLGALRALAIAHTLAIALPLSLSTCGRAVAPPIDDPTRMRSETRALYVREVETPSAAKAGEAVEVLVRGDLPNPGWKFLRWEIREAEGGALRTWVVTPLIVYTLGPGEMVAQVVVPFEGIARFGAPATPGRIAVEVRGFTPEETIRREVDVVAASTLLVMTVSGGFAGISDRIAVSEDGAITASRSLDGASAAGRLTPEEMDALRAARDAAGLPDLEPSYITENAADLFLYDITDFAGAKPIRVAADDLAMPPSLTPLVGLLRETMERVSREGRD